MRALIVLAMLATLSGCALAVDIGTGLADTVIGMTVGHEPEPYVCESTDPDVCAIEKRLYAIEQAERASAEAAAFGAMQQRNRDFMNGPRTHAEMMCAANPFEC